MKGVECDQKLSPRELNYGTEPKDIHLAIGGFLISNLKRHGGAVTLSLD